MSQEELENELGILYDELRYKRNEVCEIENDIDIYEHELARLIADGRN